MADMIQCPLCGTDNPPTQKVCQRCQTPLSLDASFQPGQAPKHKDTGELEPILPQWLQDARQSAKQNEPDESTRKIETPAQQQPAASPPDFLAGLQSQAGDDAEEEVPDWLASITGITPPKQKADEPETGGVRWVETGKKDDFQQAGSFSEEDEVPSWLAGIQTPQFGTDEKDELTDWFRESDGEGQTFPPETQQPSEQMPAFDNSFLTPASDETPDWLKQMAAAAGEKPPAAPAEPFSDSSDWFNQASVGATTAEQTPESFTPSDTPDWLSQMQADANASAQEKTPEPFNLSSETPDWLNQMQADARGAAQQEQTPEPFNVSSEAPDWLNGLGGASAPFAESAPADSEAFESIEDVPAWLASEEQDASKKVDSTPVWLQDQGDVPVGTPAWLASNEATLVQPTADAESETPTQDDDLFGDLPDWLKSAAPQSSIYDEPAATVETPKAEALKSNSPFEDTSAFEKDTFRSDGSEGLFTEMPDWLSNAMDAPSTPSMPEPITGSDALAPDVLPSWVEAMRPSDQGMANIVAASNDSTESRGALAGLSGVLPAGVGFNPTSKPKAYSIKLNASEEQLKHAGILEQILAAETAPETLASEKSLTASRGLRWMIAFILLVAAFTTIFLRTQFFSMPVGVPNELKFAVAVSQAIPPNSPVLVAVDYEAARVGEIEAASAPLFDNLILLKQPRLIFIASNETGAILSERLIAGQVAVHGAGVNALNLGYLSGGQMGIRAFAQNPSVAAPLDVSSQPAWTLPQLEDVTALDQFAAIILVTDNADAARSWVEQTQDMRGAVPIIVISSAQAAPMIQPYYDSGQVAGMVSGLYGGAIFERQYNSGRPGAARAYWDAYSIGMLLAMMFLVAGGFVNLALGVRDRAALREGK